jgi:hypothetical protein
MNSNQLESWIRDPGANIPTTDHVSNVNMKHQPVEPRTINDLAHDRCVVIIGTTASAHSTVTLCNINACGRLTTRRSICLIHIIAGKDELQPGRVWRRAAPGDSSPSPRETLLFVQRASWFHAPWCLGSIEEVRYLNRFQETNRAFPRPRDSAVRPAGVMGSRFRAPRTFGRRWLTARPRGGQRSCREKCPCFAGVYAIASESREERRKCREPSRGRSRSGRGQKGGDQRAETVVRRGALVNRTADLRRRIQ